MNAIHKKAWPNTVKQIILIPPFLWLRPTYKIIAHSKMIIHKICNLDK